MFFSTKIRRTAAGIAAMGLLVVLSASGTAADVDTLTRWISGNNNPKVSGSNRLMVVMVMGEHTAAFSANRVTYGGQQMTRQTDKIWGSSSRTYASIFTLSETGVSAASSGTIAVTWSTTPSAGSSIYSVLLSGVDQNTSVSATANNGLDGTSITTSALAAASGDMIVVSGATSSNNTVTFNNGFTESFESNTTWGDGVGGYKKGTGASETPGYTQSSSGRMVICAISVRKSASVQIPSRPVYGAVVDMDGNTYRTMIIGNQEWTLENIRSATLNDGTAIPHVTDNGVWAGLTTPGYCFYNNSASAAERKKWGALYNWHTVATGKLAPPAQEGATAATNWHIPTDADWTALETYLIASGYNYDGTTTGNKLAKSMATGIWGERSNIGVIGCNLSENNRSGFSAFPLGYRMEDGTFYDESSGYLWSASENDATHSYCRLLYYGASDLQRLPLDKRYGVSVRLVRDVK